MAAVTQSAPPPALAPERSVLRAMGIRLAIVVVFFAAVAPTLALLEFFHAEENIVIAQALEMRRTGHWLIPTLQGRPRTIKPPLTVWITAAAIRPRTLARLDDSDPAARAAAYRDLAFETRWPTILCAGLMLVAVYELGRAITPGARGSEDGGGAEDDRDAAATRIPFGLLCACVCGTTWYFLIRQGSKNTVDLQLALWVSVANACLAWGVLRGRWWTAFLGGGVALGLATMSKGPAVPLLQSVVPVVAYALWRCRARDDDEAAVDARTRPPLAAVLLGVALMLIVGLWWYVVAYLRSPQIFPVWWAELTRHGANDLRDPPGHYLRALRLLFPWLAFFIVGIAAGVVLIARRRHERWLLGFFLAVLPLLVMTCFKERKERYLIPLLGPMAVIAAHAVREHLRGRATRWELWERIVIPLHWLGVAVVAIGLPIAGAIQSEQMHTLAGGPWFSRAVAAMGLFLLVPLLVSGLIGYRRNRGVLVWTTVLIMLVAQLLYNYGFSRDPAGASDVRPFAEDIRAHWPAADLYASYGGDRPGIVFTPGVELAIYTNRSVPGITDLSAVPLAPGKPTVVLVQSRKRESEPLPPPGWRQTHRQVLDNGDVLKLFVHE